jgi:hypothetical protein
MLRYQPCAPLGCSGPVGAFSLVLIAMSSPLPPELRPAMLKVERANQHVADLKSAIDAFYETKPCTVTLEIDPKSGDIFYQVSKVDPVPDDVPLLAGEVFHSLRSALDYLAYALCVKGHGSVPNWFKSIYFPICKSDVEYGTSGHTKIRGASAQAMRAIDAIEPYRSGKGHDFWVLNELNNIDKHRQLFTVSLGNHIIDYGEHVAAELLKQLKTTGSSAETLADIKDSLRYLRVDAAPRGVLPAVVGQKLMVFPNGSKVNKNLDFRFIVAINETNILNRRSLSMLVQNLSKLVGDVIPEFAPFF